MTWQNALPSQQAGQRALRLVTPQQLATPQPEEAVHPSSAPQATPSSASPTLRRLQRDLEAARAEARSLQELLEELPAILEHKFQMRLRVLLSEQRQLEQDNSLLQHHLLALQGGDPNSVVQPPALPEATGLTASTPAAEPRDTPITQGLGLRRALRSLHR